MTPWCIDLDTYNSLKHYVQNKGTPIPHGVYKMAENGSYVKTGERYATPTPPVDTKYFINLFDESKYENVIVRSILSIF